ncbi:SHOCT domain-containing protein [Deinococcus frigens]|uniref:SHOCT domain-containing protein n=1 Tax=Deinococcus frigens TaxID=249403 RepID=UPI00049657E0|nr:SHOCT domain-containing protein [Deinococcus frigens]
MDVIINNPAVPQVQYTPLTQTPAGYGPGYGPGYGDHHGGPGFLLPLLLLGGFLFFRAGGRRRWARRQQMQRPNTADGPAPTSPRDDWHLREDPREDMRDMFRRGREKFFGDGALGIARERYARGEINADEYENLRRTLGGEDEPQGPDLSKPEAGDDGLKL